MKNFDIHLLKYQRLLNEIQKHLNRLEYAFRRLKELEYMPLNYGKVNELLRREELVPLLDQIIYRFFKIQKTLGKMLRGYLYINGENVENLPILDVVNIANKYGVEIDKEKWLELRELRNILVHEYEDETLKIADTINRIYDELKLIKRVLEQLKR